SIHRVLRERMPRPLLGKSTWTMRIPAHRINKAFDFCLDDFPSKIMSLVIKEEFDA
ncbi:hypothetical protein J6590_010455, partial [Homalodisca vitripennis]